MTYGINGPRANNSMLDDTSEFHGKEYENNCLLGYLSLDNGGSKHVWNVSQYLSD
jgi:hypothetical protein